MLSVKQEGIKYKFFILWCDSTWNWAPVFRNIDEYSTHYTNGPEWLIISISRILMKSLYIYIYIYIYTCVCVCERWILGYSFRYVFISLSLFLSLSLYIYIYIMRSTIAICFKFKINSDKTHDSEFHEDTHQINKQSIRIYSGLVECYIYIYIYIYIYFICIYIYSSYIYIYNTYI